MLLSSLPTTLISKQSQQVSDRRRRGRRDEPARVGSPVLGSFSLFSVFLSLGPVVSIPAFPQQFLFLPHLLSHLFEFFRGSGSPHSLVPLPLAFEIAVASRENICAP